MTTSGWLPWVPALAGVFWGAPLLAREFERGTFRVALAQSVPRRQWLAAKLGGLGLLAALAGLALGAMVGAWRHAFDGTRFAGILLVLSAGLAGLTARRLRL